MTRKQSNKLKLFRIALMLLGLSIGFVRCSAPHNRNSGGDASRPETVPKGNRPAITTQPEADKKKKQPKPVKKLKIDTTRYNPDTRPAVDYGVIFYKLEVPDVIKPE